VTAGERVLLMMRNRPDFHWLDLGAQFVRATPVSIYNSSSPEEIEFLAGHAEARIAIVEDDGFLQRMLKVRGNLPNLQKIYVIEPPEGVLPEGVQPVSALMGHGRADLAALAADTMPDDLATLIYTSGTTGPPKGVMISQYNVVFTADSLFECIENPNAKGWRAISYLPMAHIAERMTSHYAGAYNGYEVTCCPEPSKIAEFCRNVHPQLMFGVPRIWEKFNAGVMGALNADPEKGQKFGEAVEAAKPIVRKRDLEGNLTEEEQGTLDFLDAVAFKGVRELLGLDQVEFAITGAAPIPPELIEWFRAIGVPLSEIYGMSENCGPLTWEPAAVKAGYVGRELPGVTVRLADDGEVIARGGNIFQGYLNDPEKTAEALDADGWLHTGDIGEFDDDGYLRIVDRKKELIITAGGKNISPANLEAALKSFPLIGQAAVIGDRRPYIAALVVLDPEVAPGWAKQQGIDESDLTKLADHPQVKAEIERCVAEANKRFSQVEQIKRFRILGEEWLPDSEELTPTMKLKRRGVNQKYAEEIESLYS
ncbi:MAG: AMP-dependent synthetase/ligase, partial [Acidimicrobiia bacterium]